MLKRKRQTVGLEMRTFHGSNGTYLVLRTPDGSYHTFLEVEAKQAARDCGAQEEGHTKAMWRRLWDADRASQEEPTEQTTP